MFIKAGDKRKNTPIVGKNTNILKGSCIKYNITPFFRFLYKRKGEIIKVIIKIKIIKFRLISDTPKFLKPVFSVKKISLRYQI
jgi:hypothetical protein